MSARSAVRPRAHRHLALAAALALATTGLTAMPTLTGAAAGGTGDVMQAGTSIGDGGPEVAEITHIDGVDAAGAFAVTSTEIDGTPVVTGTTPEGTDSTEPTPAAATAANPHYRALVDALAGDDSSNRDRTTANNASANAAGISRLGASSVYDTAVAVSRRAFAGGGADTVYLTRADRVGDALAAGSLRDGPVLFVPRTGTAPSNVVAEVRRLGAKRVIALGGEQAVAASVLTSAAAGRATSRLAGADSYETAVAIAARAFPDGAPEVYLAGLRQAAGGGVDDSPDAAAGGSLSLGPVLPVPSKGAVPQTVRDAIRRLAPSRVYALGGTAVVPAASLTAAAGGTATGRLAGTDRYSTSAAIARHAFPKGTKVAYLAAGASLADAVAGGSLTDGPILFTPPAGTAYGAPVAAVSGVLRQLGVTSIGALSPVTTLPARAVAAVVGAAPAVRIGALPDHPGSTSGATLPAPTASPGSRPQASVPASAAQTCDQLVRSFRPIPLPSPYTIRCVDSIGGDPRVLGVTHTQVYIDDETVARGSISIVRSLPESLLKSTIAHELAHAYSYGALTRNQRAWFVTQLRKVDSNVTSPDFNDQASYEHMPAEQWARGQSACVGWPDPYKRPAASCSLIDRTIAGRR